MLQKLASLALFMVLNVVVEGAWANKNAPAPKAQADEAEEIEEVDVAEGAAAGTAETEDWYGEGYPQFDRVLDHYTARSSRKYDFSTLIAHRNSEGILRNPLRDLLGFDGGGLKILLGLRFGILDSLDVGIARINGTVEIFDTYEFDARFQFLNQKQHPVDLAVRAGVSWFNQPNSNAAGLFVQAMVDRIILQRFLVGGGVIYHSSSSGPNKSGADAPGSTGLYFMGDLRLLDSLSLSAEVTFSLAGYHDNYPIITFGPKIITNRHTFSFAISNSQYMTTDGLVADTYRISPKDWVLGFHITREI